jgi:hypothetical protein
VVYERIKNPDYQALLKDLKSAGALESIAADLNSAIRIPKDISITFGECGSPNAFYDPNKQKITLCFELIERFATVFGEDSESAEDLEDAIVGATVFVLYHELGHALIHILDLPITGKEEDAVDQLSTLILSGDDDGEAAAINGASYFYLEYQGNDNKIDDLAFADEHSLEAQRFYNILCWIYGQNEKKFDGLVSNGVLPKDRAVRCSGEFQRLQKAWGTILQEHLR